MRKRYITKVRNAAAFFLGLSLSVPSTWAQNAEVCSDFDSFINAQWKNDNPIPSTESRWGSFNILLKENENKTAGIITELADQTFAQNSYQQQVKDLYHSLIHVEVRNQRGLEPLEKYFKIIDHARSFNDLFILNAIIPGLDMPLNGGVMQDLMNSSTQAFYISQSGLTLGDREYYLSDKEDKVKIRQEFLNHIVTIEKLLGKGNKKAQKIAEEILAIETDIASYFMAKEDMRDPFKIYNKMSISDLKKLSPNMNWDQYFATLQILPTEVIVTNTDILSNAQKIAQGHSISSWKEYMKFKLASSMANQLTEEFEKANFDFFATVMSGVKEQKPINERAIQRLNSLLGESVGRLFVSKYFSEESKERIEHMIENMREVYAERIQNLSWMSEETKKEALFKLNSFTYKIGYPTKWKDLSTINIDPNHVFENVMNVRNFRNKENLESFYKEVDKDKWEMNAHEVNAYYHPLHNEIVFPAGILQPPFFDADGDDGANYGGIGAVIGHEFSHGFDDSGSKFDGDGNLRDWWTAEDRKKFESLTERLVEQYNNYEIIPEVFVNGQYTLGENIADQGGLLLGYYALLKEYENQPEPALVDGMDYKQRFFYGWAKVWRQNARDEATKQLIAVDPHAPAKARINVAISNLKEFFEAFGCEIPDEKERVIIW